MYITIIICVTLVLLYSFYLIYKYIRPKSPQETCAHDMKEPFLVTHSDDEDRVFLIVCKKCGYIQTHYHVSDY